MTKDNPYGESIEDFDNIEKIGHGGFSEVFKARSKEIVGNAFSIVAIKRINKEKNCEDRIRREIEIHKSLPRFDSYVEFHGAFQDKKYWYLVLELCTGGSLEQYVKRKGCLSEDEAIDLITQVIEGVNVFHERNIIHRDLSWRNLLLTEHHHNNDKNKKPQVKIADFGLAVKLNHPNEKTNTVLGTPNFMAPEVLSHDYYDFKADCWSVGCVLYALLFGDPPFKNQPAGHYQLNFPENARKTKISSEVQRLLKDMLNTNPKKRIDLRTVHNILSAKRKTNLSSAKLQHKEKRKENSTSANTCVTSSNCSGVSHKKRSIQTLPPRFEPHQIDSIKSCPRSPQYPAHVQMSDKDFNSHTWSSGYASEKRCKTQNNRGTPSYKPSSFTVHSSEGNIVNYSSCSHNRCCNLNSCIHNSMCCCRTLLQSQKHLKPLSTERLRSRRKEIEKKDIVVSILNDGQVCLECLKLKKNRKYVSLVYFISSDGSKISVHKLNKKVLLDSEKPPSLSDKKSEVQHYTIENLPNTHWKKYQFAKRFVDIVRSITPKVTYYGDYGVCMMMENTPDPNFEIKFYNDFQIFDTGQKRVIKNNKGCIIDQIDHTLLEEFKELKKKCAIVEKYFEDYHNSKFPVIVGKKCEGFKKNTSHNADKENTTLYHVPSSLRETVNEMKPRTVTIEVEGSPDRKSFERNYRSSEYPALLSIKVEDDYIIAKYADGILMSISMQDDNKVFFQDVRTQVCLSKHNHPHLMKRYENDSRAILLQALQQSVPIGRRKH